MNTNRSSGHHVSECPICFHNYSDVDPTTLPCGHSCCLEDAKMMRQCHLCGMPYDRDKLCVSYGMREFAEMVKSLLPPNVMKNELVKNSSDNTVGKTDVDKVIDDAQEPKSLCKLVENVNVMSSEDNAKVSSKQMTKVSSTSSVHRTNKEIGEDFYMMLDGSGNIYRERFNKDVENGSRLAVGLECCSFHESDDEALSVLKWLLNEVTIEQCDKYCLFVLAGMSSKLMFKELPDKPTIGIDEVLKYLKRSADEGYVLAQLIYSNVMGHRVNPVDLTFLDIFQYVTVDFIESLHYLRLAVKENSVLGHIELATLYESGCKDLGINEDKSEAFRLYKAAADVGNCSLAQYKVAEFHFEGWGGAIKNNKKAIQYLQKAVARNDRQACCMLAECYENGKGVAIDYGKAFEYYKQAADFGYCKDAVYIKVAEFYEQGLIVEGNLLEAMRYYAFAFEEVDDKFHDICQKIGVEKCIAYLENKNLVNQHMYISPLMYLKTGKKSWQC